MQHCYIPLKLINHLHNVLIRNVLRHQVYRTPTFLIYIFKKQVISNSLEIIRLPYERNYAQVAKAAALIFFQYAFT